jgi:hypothetical protein
VPITGDWQDLSHGVKIRFGSRTGHSRGSRSDGKIVTICHWQEDEKTERDIAAIIWTPPARSKRRFQE